jgi:hypothetical protein
MAGKMNRNHAARSHAMQLAAEMAARNGVRDLEHVLKDAKRIRRFLLGKS